MDVVDINKLVEQAKADASAVGASKKDAKEAAPAETAGDDNFPFGVSDEHVAELVEGIEALAAREEQEEQNRAQAELERGRHVKIAKLLAAMDVFSGVRR